MRPIQWTFYPAMSFFAFLVRRDRPWLASVLGFALCWTRSTLAQESELPPSPPVEPAPEAQPAASPAASSAPAVAAFPVVEGEAAEPTPSETPAADAAVSEPPAEPKAPPAKVPTVASASVAEAAPQPVPEAAPPPASKNKSNVRLYLGGGGIFALGTSATHEWASSCPSISYGGQTLSAQCAIQSPIGGALEGQFGIRGKYVGVEGFLFGAGDYSHARLSFGEGLELPQFADGTQLGRVGAGAGATVRGFYDPGKVGISGGLGVGLIGRGIFSNLSVTDGSFEHYFASMIRFDVELSLLKFFQVGLYGWVEFAPDVTISPDLSDFNIPPEVAAVLGDITVFQGTQVFLGPYLGFRTP